jgi:hypothetical protein
VITFAANGFGYEGTNPEGENIETRNDLAIGSRLGFIPDDMIEIGGSLAKVYGLDDTHDMLLAGVDIQLSFENLELKGEYIFHQFESEIHPEFANDGFYAQGYYAIGERYLVGRFDNFRPDQRSDDSVCFSIGVGQSIQEIINLRLEYQLYEDNDNAAIFQIAIGF